MDPAAIAGVITAAAGLVGAVTALIAQYRHVNGPAHQVPAPPAAPTSSTPPPVA